MRSFLKSFFFGSALLMLAVSFYLSESAQEIAAGVAILLFGMIGLEEGFRQFSKGPLERIMRKATDNLFKSMSLGFLSTSVLQSSSLITVVTISFLSAGIMPLVSGIGVIYGANLGTTTTAWLVAAFGLQFKVSALALPLLVFGTIFNLQSNQSLKGIGGILAGLGFFFLGIQFMKEGFDAIGGTVDLSQYAMTGVQGLLVFTAMGILLTIILQSSSAAMALVLTSLFAGQVTFTNALALAIGANVGTTITAIIGSSGAGVEGKKLAMAHSIFNITTGMVALVLIKPMTSLVQWTTIEMGFGTGAYPFQLALFHTVFNLLGILLMLPFTPLMVKQLNKFGSKPMEMYHPEFLTEAALSYSGTAVSALQKQTRSMFSEVYAPIIANSLKVDLGKMAENVKVSELLLESKVKPEQLAQQYDQRIKPIYSELLNYAVKTSRTGLNEGEAEAVFRIKVAARKMVSVIKKLQLLEDSFFDMNNHSNSEIRYIYRSLHKRLVKAFKASYALSLKDEPISLLGLLEKQREKLEHKDFLLEENISPLLVSNQLTSLEASTLANDSSMIIEIGHLMIDIAELLFIQFDAFHHEHHQAEQKP